VNNLAQKISDIFLQKLNEIQSRIPLKMNTPQSSTSFQSVLDTVTSTIRSGSNAIDKEGNDRTLDVLRAKAARANSTAVIPGDKVKLMEMINVNIDASSKKYGVDPNLIRAVIQQESSYNPDSLSHTGAQGLMQLMPGTADALGVKDPWDISQNIEGGTKYIRDQLQTFNGDIKLSLAAYNAGPAAVKKYSGVPPYSETQDYVVKVLDYYRQYTSGQR
jgi:soluble lytic murein transglycosylase-like protein